jgi:hypothetical protein
MVRLRNGRGISTWRRHLWLMIASGWFSHHQQSPIIRKQLKLDGDCLLSTYRKIRWAYAAEILRLPGSATHSSEKVLDLTI